MTALLLIAPAALADSPGPTFANRFIFTEQGGAAIYAAVCAACHMPSGQGAVGAGAYPALAHNDRLSAAGYPIDRVLHGSKAMPPFGRMLTDKQIADVVTYIRTSFGNTYTDPPTAADVAAAR